MESKKDDPGRVPKSSFRNRLVVFYPCLLNGVQFITHMYFLFEKY